MPWKTIEGEKDSLLTMVEMEVLIRGMFNKKVLMDLIRHFIVYDDSETKITKKLAAYHQYHAVNKAVEATVEAASPEGDRRCGVIWHTQGSGKSLIMAFYAGKLVLEMDNPTLVVLTDRNDLDDQLFGTFKGFGKYIKTRTCPSRKQRTSSRAIKSSKWRYSFHYYSEVFSRKRNRLSDSIQNVEILL